MKVRVQTQLVNKMSDKTEKQKNSDESFPSMKEQQSILSIAKQVFKSQGIFGLYHGFWLKALGCVYDDLIYFFVYRLVERNLQHIITATLGKRSSGMTIATDFVVGSLAGCIQFFITIPVETITVNVQSQKIQVEQIQSEAWYVPLYSTIQKLYQKNGIQGFWRGYSISCLLTCNPAINFGVFEWLKKVHLNNFGVRSKGRANDLLAFSAFLLGMVSKSIAISITYPLIRIKILSQALASRRHGDVTLQVANEVVNEQGLSGLYTGLVPQILRSSIAAGIMFATRERTRAVVTKALMSLL